MEDATNVIPAAPDAGFHNRDPVYPADAAKRGQQGTVVLLVHVSPEGLPSGVEVTASSGCRLLDHAAREAVLGWHFHPGMQDGKAVDSQFALQVRFRLTP